MIEQFGKDSERSDTGRSAANVALMNSVLRGMNPIPPILPLVGYGLYANSNFYTKEVLNDLKSKGFNVISANLSVSASSGSTNEGITIIVVNTENVRESLKNCKEIGVRCIVGIGSIAPNQISLLWSATVAAADDDKLCPIWRFTYPLSVSYMVSAAERCARIIERDGWERPVLLEMLSAGSSIDSLGGSLDKGWTDDNKFEKYCQELLDKCPPMIWLSTQRAFPETIDGSTIDPLFLKSLIIIKSYADQTGRAMWSTVHSSFLIPSQFSGVKENGILLPLLPTLAGRIGLEARCALALGAKGLIYKDTCGTSDDYWYPLRTIGVNNRLGSLVQTLNSDLKSVDYAFIDTRVLNVGVLGAYDLENIIGKVTFPFGVLSSITGISGPLLVSRLCGYSKDYYVLVNLNVTTSQTLTVVFSDKVRTEDSLDYSYISKISGGDWKVFAYDLPLAKFGIKK